MGQLGCVLFSSFVSSRFDATPKVFNQLMRQTFSPPPPHLYVDIDTKALICGQVWRMVSAVALDVSTAIELLSPLAPMYFLVIASIANVGKNISFLAASASRAAIHSSFAR